MTGLGYIVSLTIVEYPRDFREGYEYYYFGSYPFTWRDSTHRLRKWHLGLHLYANDVWGMRIIGNDLDLNDDGLLDVVVTHDEWENRDNYQSYFLNLGNRRFEPHRWVWKGDTLSMIDGAWLGDINGNGKLDIIFGVMGKNIRTGIRIYYDFPWDTARMRYIYYPGSVETPYVADINDDGWPDILLAVHRDGDEAAPDGMECSTILWGAPEGYAGGRRSFCLYGGGTHVIFAADFNNDTYLDVFVGSTYYNFAPHYPPRIYWGGPDGLDSTRYSLVWTEPPPEDRLGTYGGTVADMNRDGWLDIVGCWHPVFILWNSGGRFSPTDRTLLANPDCRSLQVADMNGDGKLDIVAASKSVEDDLSKGKITIYWGDRYDYVAIPSPSAYGVYVADLDGDGWPDIVSSQKEMDHSDVYWNTGYPLFWGTTLLEGTHKASRNLSVQFFGNVFDRSNRFGFLSHTVRTAAPAFLSQFEVFGDIPEGTEVKAFVRASEDGSNFGPWIPITPSGEPYLPLYGRAFQYRLDVSTDFSRTSDFHVDSVRLRFSDHLPRASRVRVVQYGGSILLYGDGCHRYALYTKDGRRYASGKFCDFLEIRTVNRKTYLIKVDGLTFKVVSI